jgi:ribosomal protein S18 acetylase RimI-like enzyme
MLGETSSVYKKEIVPIKDAYNFTEIYEVFKDVIGKPTEENVKDILSEYKKDMEKTLYGYYLDKKLIGIIGILHFGIHPEYRGKNLGTELMDYIKNEKKTMKLTTDDDAILFYKNYGYTCFEYYEEKYNCKRYNCIYNQ